jgi:hypothetical protein
LELALEYRYSVRITPTLPPQLTAELPLPLVRSLLDEELGASNCSPVVHPDYPADFPLTLPGSPDKEIPIGITKLLFLSCPTSLPGIDSLRLTPIS